MTKYLFLTTIFAINHAGGTKTQTQNRTNIAQTKAEVSPVPSNRSQGMSSNDSSRQVSPDPQEIIRELREQNAKLLMKIDPLRDALAKKEAELAEIKEKLEEKEDQLAEKTIQLETRKKYSNAPESVHLITIDELTYDLRISEEQLEKLENEIRPHYKQLIKEKKELKSQIAQLQAQIA